jgi:hypothetical protein
VPFRPSVSGPFVRGINASTSPLAQPRGTVPRASNLLFTKRGSLQTCHGSRILRQFSGAVQNNRGRIRSIFLFQPVGVAPYYLVLAEVLDQPLGVPTNPTVSTAGGGTLAAATYFYRITAVDGGGNETSGSTEVSQVTGANGQNTLTWNVVPNAYGYNVYRSTASLGEQLMSVSNLPVIQPAAGTTTASFVDTGAGTVGLTVVPPSNSSRQTALFKLGYVPPASGAGSYSNANTIALFPQAGVLGAVGVALLPGQNTPTASGGIPGMTSNIPQIVQFVNKAVLALGNGYPPQIYGDASDPVVAATTIANSPTGAVESTPVADTSTITTTSPHGLVVGAQVNITGVTNVAFNGLFLVLTVPSTTTFTVRNTAPGAGATSGTGTVTMTTQPLVSNFVPAFPTWSATTSYATNSVVQPSPANTHFYKAVQGGISGGAQPNFPTGTGQRVADGNILWQEAGLVNTAAPAPPGAGHILVYAGSLWALNTWPSNTANGLDGPTSLRMGDVNNPSSWNPINQAFLDKDDGTDGMGLAAFTITAQGIPPVGSLVAMKDFASYQIQGVFGSSNFAIQRIKTDMGSTAPRSIQFVPGFGLVRLTHLGIAVFDGVDDRIISEEIRPYLDTTPLLPATDADLSDITRLDPVWLQASWAAQTTTPPLYALAVPTIAGSTGQLNRIFCYDLILKGWAVVEPPFNLSTFSYYRVEGAIPVVVMGGYVDGTIQSWQAGDFRWYTLATGQAAPSQVAWSFRTPSTASRDPDARLYCRLLAIRGFSTNPGGVTTASLTVTPRVNGVAQGAQSVGIPVAGDFDAFAAVNSTALRFDATIAGSGDVEIFGVNFHLIPKPLGVPLTVS